MKYQTSIAEVRTTKLGSPHGASLPVAIDYRGAAGLEMAVPKSKEECREYQRKYHREHVKHSQCVDCGAMISMYALRCLECSGVNNRKASPERVWDQLDRRGPNDCWLWKGYRNRDGYGCIYVFGRKTLLAHRVTWELTNGPIPTGMCVCHKCDNPPCCNPAHGFLGTRIDNNRDMCDKGRMVLGSARPQSRLDESIVAEIRRSVDAGERTSASWADELRVNRATVHCVVHRMTWKHVDC
jgi:hypothetical protein